MIPEGFKGIPFIALEGPEGRTQKGCNFTWPSFTMFDEQISTRPGLGFYNAYAAYGRLWRFIEGSFEKQTRRTFFSAFFSLVKICKFSVWSFNSPTCIFSHPHSSHVPILSRILKCVWLPNFKPPECSSALDEWELKIHTPTTHLFHMCVPNSTRLIVR